MTLLAPLGGGGLGPGPVSVQADPSLLAAQPDMMLAAAATYEGAAHQVQSVAHATAGVADRLVGEWKGKGASGFHGHMNDLKSQAPAAAEALIGTAAALRSLAARITEAQHLARQAMALAGQTTAASNALNTAYANATATNLAALPPTAGPGQVTQALVPSPAQAAQANQLAADAVQASQLMNQANALARQAWQGATAAFDGVTSTAPSVRAAVTAAQAKAKAKASHHGSLLGGLGNLALGGLAWLGDAGLGAADVVQGGVDPATDAATVADGVEATDLTATGVSELTGGGASAAEVASAEESAAAKTVVDGEEVGPQVAEDVAAGSVKAGESTASAEAEGLDLTAQEQAGGHTIERHVGLSDQALVARNIPYASTFNDLSAAETATAENIANNGTKISQWLQGSSPRLAIQGPMDSAAGRVYEQATQSFISPSSVNTVLVRTPSGFNVFTSYPVP